jgi:hypothetical protein
LWKSEKEERRLEEAREKLIGRKWRWYGKKKVNEWLHYAFDNS